MSVAFARGTVHGLVGENGAGKSTLAKVIGGVHQPDEGELLVEGGPVRVLVAARRARRAASRRSRRRSRSCPSATVDENVFLGIEPRRGGMIDRTGAAEALTASWTSGPASASIRTPIVRRLRTAEQQKVEILRAIARDARMILMDEPTAALTARRDRAAART